MTDFDVAGVGDSEPCSASAAREFVPTTTREEADA